MIAPPTHLHKKEVAMRVVPWDFDALSPLAARAATSVRGCAALLILCK